MTGYLRGCSSLVLRLPQVAQHIPHHLNAVIGCLSCWSGSHSWKRVPPALKFGYLRETLKRFPFIIAGSGSWFSARRRLWQRYGLTGSRSRFFGCGFRFCLYGLNCPTFATLKRIALRRNRPDRFSCNLVMAGIQFEHRNGFHKLSRLSFQATGSGCHLLH